jgi:hypothetical protein
MAPERFIAIDWSGDAQPSGQRRHIWTADLSSTAQRLSGGLTRDGVCEWLIKEVKPDSIPTVVGIDFAFSFPKSFFKLNGYSNIGELWLAAAKKGEQWLRSCEYPFWGRPGKKRPPTHFEDGFRETDRAISVKGISPKSPFQIGGAGAVGTGSIRGMPFLTRLRQEGFSIWPFDPPRFPIVVEIYPRLLTGEVNKGNALDRAKYLCRPEFASLPPEILTSAQGSEDAFDALVSALKMREQAQSFTGLKQSSNPDERLEGQIWTPPSVPSL